MAAVPQRRRRPLRIGAYLSLTGRYARFGRQAALGLTAWQSLDGDAELRIEDDRSDPKHLLAGFRDLASSCDLLLGPYSTQLMRAAGQAVSEVDALLWNHGGSGDDVQAALPGRIVSVLTPTSRYAEPFVRRLAAHHPGEPLWIVEGRGSFGRQVAAGAEALARSLELPTFRAGPGQSAPEYGLQPGWNLLCAGLFEEDVSNVNRALHLPVPPTELCAVAAGIREFGSAVEHPDAIYGIAQWFPGHVTAPAVGPSETAFLAACSRLASGTPDYPAVQAAATAALATHCARAAGTVDPQALWSMAAGLDTTTLFGSFQIDPVTGTQTRHRMVLVRWAAGAPTISG